MVLLSIAGADRAARVVAAITGADDLTSSGTIGAALALAVPIGLAGLGGLWAERAGVVNIGLEGMMILGTWGAGWAALPVGPVGRRPGRRCSFGALGGLLHALATVTFGVDHIVSGVAINILALGVAQYLVGRSRSRACRAAARRSRRRSPDIADRLGARASATAARAARSKDWFLVSDVAGIAAGLLTDVSLLTVIAIAAGVGYLLRAVAHRVRPAAALLRREPGRGRVARRQRLPVQVLRRARLRRASPASAARSWRSSRRNIYREGQTGGRGFIGLAAMIFGNWRPGGLAAGAGAVRLHRRAAAAPRRRVGARPAAARRGRCCSALGVWQLVRGAAACRGHRRVGRRRRWPGSGTPPPTTMPGEFVG